MSCGVAPLAKSSNWFESIRLSGARRFRRLGRLSSGAFCIFLFGIKVFRVYCSDKAHYASVMIGRFDEAIVGRLDPDTTKARPTTWAALDAVANDNGSAAPVPLEAAGMVPGMQVPLRLGCVLRVRGGKPRLYDPNSPLD